MGGGGGRGLGPQDDEATDEDDALPLLVSARVVRPATQQDLSRMRVDTALGESDISEVE